MTDQTNRWVDEPVSSKSRNVHVLLTYNYFHGECQILCIIFAINNFQPTAEYIFA